MESGMESYERHAGSGFCLKVTIKQLCFWRDDKTDPKPNNPPGNRLTCFEHYLIIRTPL